MNTDNNKVAITNKKPQIICLPKSKIATAAQMMADAFFDDPLASYLIPSERHRRPILKIVFKIMIANAIQFGCTYCSYQENINTSGFIESNPILGLTSWIPPSATSPTTLRSSNLIDTLLLDCDRFLVERFITIFTKTDIYRLRDSRSPHWLLELFAVSPNAQGQWISNLLLRSALQQSDSQGEMCYLFTYIYSSCSKIL